MKTHRRISGLVRRSALVLIISQAITTSVMAEENWVTESNQNAQSVLDIQAKYAPEGAAGLGVQGYDEAIFDLREGVFDRAQADTLRVIEILEEKLTTAEHPKVIQDLEILIQAAKDAHESAQIGRDNLLPYFNLSQTLFFGFQSILDPRVDPSRYPAALKRLEKYTGQAEGYTPLVDLAKARTQERFAVNGLLGPYKQQLEQDLANAARFSAGLDGLFAASNLEGWEDNLALLKSQLDDYSEWLKAEILPRARESHLLPEAVYADNLKNFGVDLDPRELMTRAQFGFMEIRSEMQAIAARIAEERNLPSADYRDVMRELKKDQIPNDQVLSLYKERLKLLEDIVRREKIISLPERDAVIRLASEAESAGIPAPHLSPPQLIGNTGQPAEFVLVTSNPTSEGGQMDDWNHDAVTWTLTVHEARPGHELQFASMIENGVSVPRAIFAFNSANVEGWALYAEAIMKPYLPLEGQLFSLQGRLQRAARAFIDPMINLGMMERDEALQFLMDEVVLSEPMASQEIDRYSFRAPGQATSYYYGYMNLMRLRTEVELILRDKFNQQAYHDFILAQGLLPPDLLRKAVLEEFIPSQT